MSEPFWKTAISKVEPNKIVVRGYNLIDLVGKYSYTGFDVLALAQENSHNPSIPR